MYTKGPLHSRELRDRSLTMLLSAPREILSGTTALASYSYKLSHERQPHGRQPLLQGVNLIERTDQLVVGEGPPRERGGLSQCLLHPLPRRQHNHILEHLYDRTAQIDLWVGRRLRKDSIDQHRWSCPVPVPHPASAADRRHRDGPARAISDASSFDMLAA